MGGSGVWHRAAAATEVDRMRETSSDKGLANDGSMGGIDGTGDVGNVA